MTNSYSFVKVKNKFGLKVISKILSVLFHPLFILSYLFFLLHIITPHSFIFSEEREALALVFLVVGLSVFFPLVSIGAFRAIGLIDSFEMEQVYEEQ